MGRVNVICGPNNSGKTTLLECLADPKLLNLGIRLDEATFAFIESNYMSGTSWGHSDRRDGFFLELFEGFLA